MAGWPRSPASSTTTRSPDRGGASSAFHPQRPPDGELAVNGQTDFNSAIPTSASGNRATAIASPEELPDVNFQLSGFARCLSCPTSPISSGTWRSTASRPVDQRTACHRRAGRRLGRPSTSTGARRFRCSASATATQGNTLPLVPSTPHRPDQRSVPSDQPLGFTDGPISPADIASTCRTNGGSCPPSR